MTSPVSVLFGPWAPDLGNNGVEIGPLGGPVPAADVLNVYYSNSAYRCLPAPASIGPTLGIPITNAVNWYDNSTGSEEVFAATANGIYMLADGAWTQVPIQTSSSISATGQAVSVSLGNPTYAKTEYSFDLSPTSQTQSALSSTYTFAAEVVSTTPSPDSYGSGSFSGTAGSGSWSVVSGDGTDSVIAGVTGCTAGQTSSATLNYSVTIGGTSYPLTAFLSFKNTQLYNAGSPGLTAGQRSIGGTLQTGYVEGVIGSVTVGTDASGFTFQALAFEDSQLTLEISGDVSQSYFTTLYIGSTPYTSASVESFLSGGSGSTWIWAVAVNPFVNGDSYLVNYQ